jgi:hypothetical protein
MSLASCLFLYLFLDRQILSRATTRGGLWVQGEPSAALQVQHKWPYSCVHDAPTTALPVDLIRHYSAPERAVQRLSNALLAPRARSVERGLGGDERASERGGQPFEHH